jgi:hypothetical protein
MLDDPWRVRRVSREEIDERTSTTATIRRPIMATTLLAFRVATVPLVLRCFVDLGLSH